MIDKELFVYNIDFLYDHIEYHLDNPEVEKQKNLFFSKQQKKEFFFSTCKSEYVYG
jgi:hypothetical protein